MNHLLAREDEAWLFSCGELHITEAEGTPVGPLHMDGAAGVLLGALTIFAHRYVQCLREPDETGTERLAVYIENRPGILCMGAVTGPAHRVYHGPCGSWEVRQQGGAALSISVVFRCALVPHDRARHQRSMPTPQPVFEALPGALRDALCHSTWRLPTLAECVACYKDPKREEAEPLACSEVPRGTKRKRMSSFTDV